MISAWCDCSRNGKDCPKRHRTAKKRKFVDCSETFIQKCHFVFSDWFGLLARRIVIVFETGKQILLLDYFKRFCRFTDSFLVRLSVLFFTRLHSGLDCNFVGASSFQQNEHRYGFDWDGEGTDFSKRNRTFH